MGPGGKEIRPRFNGLADCLAKAEAMSAMGKKMGFDRNVLRPQSCTQDQGILDRNDIIVLCMEDEMRWCVCGDIEMRAVGRFEGCRCRGPDQFLAASGMGKGGDPAYVETNHGRVIDAKGIKARYVRLWSNGNTSNDMNHYCEVQVYGTPAK